MKQVLKSLFRSTTQRAVRAAPLMSSGPRELDAALLRHVAGGNSTQPAAAPKTGW